MKAKLLPSLALLLILETCVTLATAYQHHSEARWEISATFYFGIMRYVLERFFLWILFAAALFSTVPLRYRLLSFWQLVGIGLILDGATTIGSTIFSEKNQFDGIYYSRFTNYLVARMAVWIPLTCIALWTWIRRSGLAAAR